MSMSDWAKREIEIVCKHENPDRKVDDGLPAWMTRHQTEPVKCPYCQEGYALVEGKTNDTGIAIQYPNRLIAYGYDIHGPGSNGLSVRIDYCPMCGRSTNGNKRRTQKDS